MSWTDAIGRTLDFIRSRKKDYQLTFRQLAGQHVLMDLADFCRAGETCVVAPRGQPVDRDRTLILEGRREVWLRIQQNLNLSSEELYRIYTGKEISTQGEHNG